VAQVFIPPAIRSLVGGREVIEAEGRTVAAIIDNLNDRFPGLKAHLCEGTDLRTGLSVAVGNSVSSLGLLQRVSADDEVHFLPSIGGGC
jgi:molybdopterin synthase sulfur carrier subunit